MESGSLGIAKRWWPVLVWMALIFFMSSLPKEEQVPIPLFGLLDNWDWGDKIKHIAGYAVLGALAWRSLGDRNGKWRRFWLAVGVSVVYGATDEFHQRFVTGRCCDLMDWFSDAVGASIGAMVMLMGGGKTWQRRTTRTRDTKSRTKGA